MRSLVVLFLSKSCFIHTTRRIEWWLLYIFLYDSHHKCNTRRDVMRYEVIYTALGGTPTPMTSGDHYH